MSPSVAAKPCTLKTVVVDDHPIVRKALVELIRQEPDMAVCSEIGTVASALDQIRATGPDVAIVDLSLGDESGLDLVKALDAMGAHVRVLILSMREESGRPTSAPRSPSASWPEPCIRSRDELIRAAVEWTLS